MSLKDQKKQPAKDINNKALSEEEVELSEKDLDTVAGGSMRSSDVLQDDNFVLASCSVTNNCK